MPSIYDYMPMLPPGAASSNLSKRNFAFSGRATEADIPWLYATQAEAAAANQPAGIGQPGGGTPAEGAPNPMASGGIGGGGSGGSSGGADTGLPGPGQSGMGDEFDQFYRDYLAEGGQAGEPGGAGAGSVAFGEDGYINLDSPFGDLLDIVNYGAPFPLSMVAGLARSGIRAGNVGRLDEQLEAAGFESGLSGWQQVGAAFGLNDYGEGSGWGNLAGSAAAQRSAYEGEQGFNSISGTGDTYRTSPAGPTSRVGQSAAGGSAAESSLAGAISPGAIAARAQSRVGELGFFGGNTTAGSAYGGGHDAGGRGGDRGGDQGHGGGGDLGSDRDRGFGGPRHDGGPIYGRPGEEVDHTLLAGEYVMNPEAVAAYGPETFESMNALARRMKPGATRRKTGNPQAMWDQSNKPIAGRYRDDARPVSLNAMAAMMRGAR